jgi:DNA-binding SARP family transcriptional activator
MIMGTTQVMMEIDRQTAWGKRQMSLGQFPQQPTPGVRMSTRLVELMRASRGTPFFICAPHKTGRTSLALEYAQRQHSLNEVLWIDAASEGFCEAANAGTLLEHLERQRAGDISHFSLVVLDDLPALEDRPSARLSDWIDCLIEDGVEVIVITTPYEDCLNDYQSDRLTIEGAQLIASQRWSRERMAAALEDLFCSCAPRESLILAALMILMGRGIVDSLRELGYLIPSVSYAMLKRCCPFIEFNEGTGHFDATGLPVMELRQHLLSLLNEAARTGEEGGASETGAPETETSIIERCFERLTQLATRLFERSERERSQLLLELAGSLLTCDDAGFPLAGAEPAASSVFNPAVILKPSQAGGELLLASKRSSALSAGEPEMLSVRLFGDFELFRGGTRIEGKHLYRSKVRALLVHLTLNRGCGISRDALMEKLWPGKDFLHARDNFHATWSRLNRLLAGEAGPSPYLVNNRGLCRLEPSCVKSDIWEFEQLSRVFLFEQGSAEGRVEAVYRLEQLYRGDILSGSSPDSSIQAAQQRYRSILVDVMLEASKLFSQQGNETNAVWFARRAYDTDPSREDVYRILMDMQDRAGQRTNALKTYFDCKRFLSEELGIMPSQKTTSLYQELILDRR